MFFTAAYAMSAPAARRFEAEIVIDRGSATARVSAHIFDAGERTAAASFYFDLSQLDPGRRAGRISALALTDAEGRSVGVRTLAPGEYLAAAPFERMSYTIELAGRNSSAAHASWVSADTGLLMTRDLLPHGLMTDAISVKFVLPDNWKLVTSESANGGAHALRDVTRSLFVVGSGLRLIPVSAPGVDLQMAVAGTWHFTDAEAAAMAAEVYREYRKLFAVDAGTKSRIFILRFPEAANPGSWQAETSGDTLSIISSDMNFRTQSLQRLHEQLRHELFHLWLPNTVKLKGNYAWFYEGFALYQSLKTGVRLNRIRFDDFLDTLSRAHAIDARRSGGLSLIEASRAAASGDTQIYARGMLAAFVADLSLLSRSKGRISTDDVLKRIVAEHGSAAVRTDANQAVVAALLASGVDPLFVERYIRGSGAIDWETYIASAGIEFTRPGAGLSVVKKPNGRQQQLLDKLGYNNWRKLNSQ